MNTETTAVTFDSIELKVSLTPQYAASSAETPEVYLLTQAVYINGENLAPDHPIDLIQLAKSCQIPGEFFIVTCGCGVAQCASIEDGIQVTHYPNQIAWEVPLPMSYKDLTAEEADWHSEHRTYRRFNFEPDAYLAAIQHGLREAKGLLFSECQPIECSPYGFDPEDLLELDPIVFSERAPAPGCQIVGKKVTIDRSPSWVEVNGISYDLKELPVPADIKALDDWSIWEPKPCESGLLWGIAAAPEYELRRRLKLLGNHLASITRRGGEVIVTLWEDWQEDHRYRYRRHQVAIYGRAALPPDSK